MQPNIADLANRLGAAGIRLWRQGDRLHYEAARGAVTAELLQEMHAHKSELLELLRAASDTLQARQQPRFGRVERLWVDGRATMPVSATQQRLWFLHQLDQTGCTYNVPKAVRLRGALNLEALQHALPQIIARHESLRTSFVARRGTPVQIIHEWVEFALAEDDVSARPDRLAAARGLATREAETPFDLSCAPLLRARLIRLAADDHILAIVLHHIVADGRSLEILFEELAALYGGSGVRPAPTLQYADYAAFEEQWLVSGALDAKIAWWSDRLADAPTMLQLPTERPRPAMQSFAGDMERFALSVDAIAALRRAAAESGASLYMAVIAALGTVLSRWSGQNKIAIGCPVENRTFPETARLIGAFANTVVLPVAVDETCSFAALLARLRDAALEAYDRQEVPIEKLIEVMHPERNPSASPLFQVAVSSLDGRKGFPALPGIATEPFEFTFQHVKFDINLELYETDRDLHVAWFYSTALFDRDTITRMIGHFVRLIERAAAEPGKPLAAVEMIDEPERRRLVVEWNATDAPLPATNLPELIAAHAAAQPEALAIIDGGRRLTYGELERRANRLACDLAAAGVGKGATVGALFENSPELVIVLLGILKAGAAYLPLDPRLPPGRLATIVADAALRVVVGNAGLAASPQLGDIERLVTIEPLDAPLKAAPPATVSIDPRDAAYVIYTSGSTGRPKGVVVEHHSLLNYLLWAQKVYLRGEALDFPLFTPVSFDLTVTSLWLPLISLGRVVVYRDEGTVPAILRVMRDQAVDVVKLTPAHLAMIQDADFVGARIRRLIVGGEDLKTDLCRRIYDAFEGAVEIFNEYGPTEATVGCMIHRFDPVMDRGGSVPIGRPADNTHLYVLDCWERPAPIGVVGELHIAGKGVARGYLNQPERTAERFLPELGRGGGKMYRSGDLVRWRTDGVMEYLGRADHQVKIRGHRIELDEVAAALATHPAVGDCVAHVIDRGVLDTARPREEVRHCVRCGLASNVPGTVLDAAGVCDTCRAFEEHRHRVAGYFGTPENLMAMLTRAAARKRGHYDCLVLLSGGKDSTYMLARLVEMGLCVMAYTLDPGYLSEAAKANIRRITAQLGVDHVFGSTPDMNEIFVDSLQRHANVCNGCFKTLYTLSIALAKEKGIPAIVTGLSRGQLFETRLSKYYHATDFDPRQIDEAVIRARKIYHRLDDMVARRLDVGLFQDDRIFNKIEIVDFYRYVDVSLADMLSYLEGVLGWRRPADTGRSTNCLINDVGIYIHRRRRGYHNYALPYSWDVRMGHKRRDEALFELDDKIDPDRVQKILSQIGYREPAARASAGDPCLVAYYVPKLQISPQELREHLAGRLPEAMIPSFFVALDTLPLTANGKIDRRALLLLRDPESAPSDGFVTPRTALEMQIVRVWSEALGFDRIGVNDNFFALGGHSLMATRVAAQLAEELGVELPLATLFEKPTVSELAAFIAPLTAANEAAMAEIIAEVEAISDAEVRAQLTL